MTTNPGLASLFRFLVVSTALRLGKTGYAIDTSGYDGAVNFEITGEGGGTWHCVLGTGYMRLHAGAHPSPLGTARVSVEDFFRLLTRETTCSSAALSGRLRVDGEAFAGVAFGGMFEQLRAAREMPGLAGWVARFWTDRALRRSGCGRTLAAPRP